MYHLLGDRSDLRAITNLLDSICPNFPAYFSDECERLVTQFFEPATRLVVNTVTTDRICESFDICPRKENEPKTTVK